VGLPVRLLRVLETWMPGKPPAAKRWFVERAVPLNRAIGLRVEEVAPDSSRVVLSLAERRRNRNAGGTIHGAVLTALAETIHGVAVLWQFSPDRHTMVQGASRGVRSPCPRRPASGVRPRRCREAGDRVRSRQEGTA
jgi:hypothetical protein